jgi:signal transduction histidine kinase
VSRPQLVPVDELLSEVRELLLDRLEPNDIQIVTNVRHEAKNVFGDHVQLKQALYNIIDNSVDAIENAGLPGTITVVVEARSPSVTEFIVSDSGPGFSEELIDFGVTPLVSTKPEGTGIGLSIARSVAEAHGGTIAIEYENGQAVVRLRIAASQQTTNEHGHAH